MCFLRRKKKFIKTTKGTKKCRGDFNRPHTEEIAKKTNVGGVGFHLCPKKG